MSNLKDQAVPMGQHQQVVAEYKLQLSSLTQRLEMMTRMAKSYMEECETLRMQLRSVDTPD